MASPPSYMSRRSAGWTIEGVVVPVVELGEEEAHRGEAPLAVVRGRYRFRLLVKSPRNFDLSAYLRQWMADAPKAKGTLKLEVDVDPQSFF